MKRFVLIGLLTLAPTLSFAQEQQQGTPASVTVLQNMVGQLAGQNALLIEQNQKLLAENGSLKQKLAVASDKKPTEAPTSK